MQATRFTYTYCWLNFLPQWNGTCCIVKPVGKQKMAKEFTRQPVVMLYFVLPILTYMLGSHILLVLLMLLHMPSLVHRLVASSNLSRMRQSSQTVSLHGQPSFGQTACTVLVTKCCFIHLPNLPKRASSLTLSNYCLFIVGLQLDHTRRDFQAMTPCPGDVLNKGFTQLQIGHITHSWEKVALVCIYSSMLCTYANWGVH